MTLHFNSFNVIRSATHCPFALKAKIFYATPWEHHLDIYNNLQKILASLIQFTLYNQDSDGYVIIAPGQLGNTLTKVTFFLNQVLTFFSDHDPGQNPCLKQNILHPDWQFTFNQVRLFVTVFSPCYPKNHARFTYNEDVTVIFFQPEQSFYNKRIPRGEDHKKTREWIRKNFALHNQNYCSPILNQPIEAYRYVKPLHNNENPVIWWKL